jgi:hypothetical protein
VLDVRETKNSVSLKMWALYSAPLEGGKCWIVEAAKVVKAAANIHSSAILSSPQAIQAFAN